MPVRRFLDRLATGTAEERAEVVQALVRAYLEADLGAHERAEIEKTFIVLLDDPAPRVRRALATAIAPAPSAPRSLIRALLADRADVAEPLLRNSPLLADGDLIALVDGFDDKQRLAVASRPSVSVPLAAALVEVSGPKSCLALLDNPGASIASSSFRRLVERHRRDPTVRSALLERDDLPPALRQMLVDGISEELQDSPLVTAFLSPEKTRRILADARDKAAVELAAGCQGKALRQHVEGLHAERRLGATVMLRAVVDGNISMIAEALSVLARVPVPRATALLHETSEPALRALWRKSGLPAFALKPFVRLLAGWRRSGSAEESDLEAALEICRDATEEGSDAVRQVLARLAHERATAAAREETGGYFSAA